MKLKKILLRWYKSFHLNYRGVTEKGESVSYRPWNKMSPSYAPADEFPFIEIPVEQDITTIVGANESGKSHLLNAISKVVRGAGIDSSDKFKRTDLCHYAGVRTRNIEAWPNIGLQFSLENESELNALNKIFGAASPSNAQQGAKSIVLILAPEGDEREPARLFVEPNDQPLLLDETQLSEVRKLLPSVQFIDSHALLSSEVSMAQLIAVCGDAAFANVGLLDKRAVESAAKAIQELPSLAENQQVSARYIERLKEIQETVRKLTQTLRQEDSLEMHLFKEILDISLETQKYLYSLSMDDRTFIEGQISKWNDEMSDRLNLAHFWRQDEDFSVKMNHKDGVIYFEIHDKTDAVYTFKERSSGMKFFLSYYIQAKAMELSSRNQNSIILMDEPDSALSILGQRNLLSVFESLVSPESSNQTCQLIYTTHSPYLINRNFPRRIRVVKKEDAEEGTQYIEQARSRRYEPVRTALGIDAAPSLLLGSDNILLEGPTDQYLLMELIRVFATPSNVGEFLDLNAVVTVSADGVGNIPNVLEQSRWADEPIPPTVVLVDSDKAGIEILKRISNNSSAGKMLVNSEFATHIGTLVQPFERNLAIITSEDIIPATLYQKAVLAYFKKWLPETFQSHAGTINALLQATDFGKAGLVNATKELFKEVKPEFEGDFDKMGILQEAIALASAGAKGATEDEFLQLRKNLILVCDFIRDALAKSRAATAKHSTTQAVKRIISDFYKLNKDNVPITSLQKMFQRLERDVSQIGNDGAQCLRLINRYLNDLQILRTAGQERIVKEKWMLWKNRIDQIMANPLTAEEHSDISGKPS